MNAIYAWLIKDAGREDIEKFDADLRKPPPGAIVEDVRDSGGWEPGDAGADFMAQLAARGGAGRVGRDGVTNVDVGGE